MLRCRPNSRHGIAQWRDSRRPMRVLAAAQARPLPWDVAVDDAGQHVHDVALETGSMTTIASGFYPVDKLIQA